MSANAVERLLLDEIMADLRADGYDVIRQPSPPMLPSFLIPYAPDLIALREDGNIAIEIKSGSEHHASSRGANDRLSNEHPNWTHKVYLAPQQTVEPLRVQSIKDIELELGRIDTLLSQDHASAGFLLSWAVFEALGRKLIADRFQRPQTPGRLIETLATEGFITPDEAGQLRPLAKLRNRLVHGELNSGVELKQVNELAGILKSLFKIAAEPA